MAARRLILILLVMLVLSSFAAALVPPRETVETESSSTAPATGQTTEVQRREPVEKTVDASSNKRRTIRIGLGERLLLTVTAESFRQVEIPAFGALEDVDPALPAIFDLAPFEAGRYPVVQVDPERRIATIVVRPPRQKTAADAHLPGRARLPRRALNPARELAQPLRNARSVARAASNSELHQRAGAAPRTSECCRRG